MSFESVNPKCCPICGIATSYVYRIEESNIGKSASWYRCQCGVIFQENFPEHKVYNKKYHDDYSLMKEGNKRLIHSARTYANIIEELTMGRVMLDVGYCVPHNMQYFNDRGWIVNGIDINKDVGGKGHLHRGDFLTYDFSIPAHTQELKELAQGDSFKREFDLIWLNHSLEHFNDPLGALRKAVSLLSESGVIFIGTPDVDFINKTGVPGYPHFKMEEHYCMWNESSLCRELEKLGMKIIVKRRNFSSRYSSWFDLHIVAQKNYF